MWKVDDAATIIKDNNTETNNIERNSLKNIEVESSTIDNGLAKGTNDLTKNVSAKTITTANKNQDMENIVAMDIVKNMKIDGM